MEQNFLNLGDMLTFIGLIIALYQFAKPRYLLVWKLSSMPLRYTVILLLIMGYTAPLFAIFAPEEAISIANKEMYLGEYIQVAGFIFISMGALVLAYIFTGYHRSRLLTRYSQYKPRASRYPKKKWRNLTVSIDRKKITSTKSAKKFFEVTSKARAEGHLKEVVDIVGSNLSAIIPSAAQYSSYAHRDEAQENEEYEPKGSDYCFEILNQLLTDKPTMKLICEDNLPFLYTIVRQEKLVRSKGFRSELSNLIYPNIVENLAINENSFLYKQIDTHKGSARFANIYMLLADKEVTSRQNIIPSQLTWHVSKTSVSFDVYTKAIGRLLELIAEDYKSSPGNSEQLGNIRSLLGQIIGWGGVSRRIAYSEKHREELALDPVDSETAKTLQSIKFDVVRRLFSYDEQKSFIENEEELSTEFSGDLYDQRTLIGLAAYKMFELIQDVVVLYSESENRDEAVRRAMHEYLSLTEKNEATKLFKQLTLDRLFDKSVDGKVEQYTTNLQGYYPNVLRHLIDYLLPFTSHMDDVDKEAIKRMKKVLKKELKEALLKGVKMKNDKDMKDVLLPAALDVKINKSKKQVRYFYVGNDGKRTPIKLS